jgi:hypothetical protein
MKWIKGLLVILIAPLFFAGCFTGPGMPPDPYASGYPGGGWDMQRFMNDDNAARIRTQLPHFRGLK